MNLFALILVGVASVVGIVLLLVLANFFGVWLRAKVADAPVPFAKLIGMRLRRVPVGLIVDSRITAVKAGLPLDTDSLEAHYLSGGNVTHVVLALIAADKAGITLDFNRACAIDLAIKGTSKTVLEAVRTSINPKVIDCPNPQQSGGRVTIDAVARDGIGVKVRARVTVRSNLDRFVGGATEETIIARVGEGIVTSIGSAVPTRTSWRTRTGFRRSSFRRAWIAEQRSRSFRWISRTWISAITSARSFRPSRPRPTKSSPRPRPRCAAPPPWPANRR